MRGYKVAGRTLATDRDGYLRNLDEWSPAAAEVIASEEEIALTGAHWEVIELLRNFYAEYQLSPAMRPLINYLKLHLDKDKARSLYLMQLFPNHKGTGSPAKVASKIAGLPRPANCF